MLKTLLIQGNSDQVMLKTTTELNLCYALWQSKCATTIEITCFKQRKKVEYTQASGNGEPLQNNNYENKNTKQNKLSKRKNK